MGRQYRHRPQMVNRRVPYLASRILDTSSHIGPKEQGLFARFGNLTRPKNATASTMLSKTSTVPNCAEWRLQLTTIQLIALGIVNQAECSTTGELTFQWIQKRFKYFEIYESALSMPCGKWTRLIHWPKNERSRLVSSMCFHEAGHALSSSGLCNPTHSWPFCKLTCKSTMRLCLHFTGSTPPAIFPVMSPNSPGC